MKNNRKLTPYTLENITPQDQEEKEFIHSYNNAVENDNLVDIPLTDNLKKEFRNAATVTLARIGKNKNINIRMQQEDLNSIRKRAQEAGIPYQTLIGSILHQYATGKLEIKI